ncbi:MAG: polysaccharide deacetylase family protein [Rhodospirillaceae bacterium]|jgi:peptidoglycan/xylan/chitin deacetylase (PgdA/CDA1 family)|nr:polysaccharide deacetylase family protein [Rhodospirillaceae bacterium]MBT5081846.1 polysaccharide deacetylase family protein [Rhodospirillaceae bacterium]MBT5524916.1 polysaccharide deacetylase family protein [Rhodospirillaceae bacterium]MBT5881381.1 polysaccharide deacetylase family protein [Rhodospirillaceae bacterium]MBT6587652.1 polysaccharide deacetylase family protein [Rhodospirillaceae bacterium]
MSDKRRPGMDHDLYPYSSILTRPQLSWPGEKRLAIWVVLHLEQWELQSPASAIRDARFKGEFGNFFPDYRTYSTREYGNRVGIFRILDVLDRYQIPVTVAANAALCDARPQLIEECLKRGYEIAAHGSHATRMITSKMSRTQEEDYIHQAMATVRQNSGVEQVGWIGQDFGESPRTPQILSQAGVDYLGDWPNDDQPYWLTLDPPLVSLPYHVEWDDGTLMALRQLTAPRYGQMVREAADRLQQDATDGPARMMSIGLHPWVVGQPQRVRYLDQILAHLQTMDGLWFAAGRDIAASFRNQTVMPEPPVGQK